MRLADEVTKNRLAAGGPGSGRHPGSGLPGEKFNHIAKQHGFKSIGVHGNDQYTMQHPTGAKLHIRTYSGGANANWSLHDSNDHVKSMGHEDSHLNHELGKISSPGMRKTFNPPITEFARKRK